MLNRRGASLVELLVALTIASIVLAAATASLLRQQRTHSRIAGMATADVQLHAGTRLLASQLGFIDASAGDLVQGETADTALELRAPIASAISCDRAAGRATFLPSAPDAVPLMGFAAQPRVGDSLWFLADSGWKAGRIASVTEEYVNCPAPFSASGSSLRLTLGNAVDTIPAGSPLRVTRATRYSFYQSGDGTWQLGFREWSEATATFSPPQPVAGPFLRYAGARSSRFRYFGSGGDELAGTRAERSAARIRIVTYALVPAREAGQDSVRSDSVDVALQHAIIR